jgi:hypothetical protein
MKRFAVVFPLVFLTGCSVFPWHPFGTPLTREKAAEQRVEVARDKAGSALVEETHKTRAAIEIAQTNPLGLPVALQHSRTAVTLADQIHGAPTVIDEVKWQELINRQTSLDAKIREAANAENSGRIRQIAQLSQDLEVKDRDLDRANKKVLEYAKEKEAIADRFLKLCWAVGILVGLYFLGQVLQFLANFNPAFQNAANLVNTFVSPVLHSGFHKARQALAGTPR